jgi:hypothetical protein
MKRAIAIVLAGLFPAESRACCPNESPVELLGWSRDGTRALLRTSPSEYEGESGGAVRPDRLVLMDTRSNRVLERFSPLPQECGWEDGREMVANLSRVLRLVEIAPLPDELDYMSGLWASADLVEGTHRLRSFAIYTHASDSASETHVATLRGRPSGELETGGLYEPAADAWSLFDAAGAPPRGRATEVFWTGTDLIATDAGADRAWRYDVDEGRWSPTLLTVSPACPRR